MTNETIDKPLAYSESGQTSKEKTTIDTSEIQPITERIMNTIYTCRDSRRNG